ncbi:acyl-CoA thioesterase [Gulosibacter chungangensis]|uniref:Acyl-CoA thioesterase 2 n=1 Tax=Gulosibacter chungangensis TaxID=979746 RepID=A0A7J5BB50_9MICO|nr:acyl-CoA thioesterase II [Gulosibacter chungangensis]KAB1642684.1 acyl-CoA thioesterase II [Gulosibacter chungangensis]
MANNPLDHSNVPELGDIDKLPPLESFLETLNLVDTGARTSNDIFTGKSQWMPHGRIFGGQVSAQSIIAASMTVDESRPMHSMHGYFLRPGDVRYPITFAVDRIHDGGSFSTRSVRAYQHGKQIWSMIASFQVEEEGLSHAVEMPHGIPDPETLESEASQVAVAGESLANYWVHRRPFAMRHVDGPLYLQPAERRKATETVWVKAQGALPDDPAVHRAALCYVSDYLMLDPMLRRHGLTWIDRRIRVASLDHGLRWHRFARADEWLLFELESPSAQNGRGLANGRFFDRQGRLIASVSQEAMFRLKEG